MSSDRVSRIGENVSVAMAMITPEGTNDIGMSFLICHCHSNIRCYKFHVSAASVLRT